MIKTKLGWKNSPEYLILRKVLFETFCQSSWGFRISTKGFLHNDPGPAITRWSWQACTSYSIYEYIWRYWQIKEAIRNPSTLQKQLLVVKLNVLKYMCKWWKEKNFIRNREQKASYPILILKKKQDSQQMKYLLQYIMLKVLITFTIMGYHVKE